MHKVISIFTIVTVLLSFSCKKYPDGNTFSIHSHSALVTNNWVCEQVLVNNSESTGFYKQYTYNYAANNSYSEYNGYTTMSGTWQLTSNDDSLIVKLNTNQVLHRYKVLKLKNSSLWLTENVNTATYEWHMKSK
jgi:hypothetical protein